MRGLPPPLFLGALATPARALPINRHHKVIMPSALAPLTPKAAAVLAPDGGPGGSARALLIDYAISSYASVHAYVVGVGAMVACKTVLLIDHATTPAPGCKKWLRD